MTELTETTSPANTNEPPPSPAPPARRCLHLRNKMDYVSLDSQANGDENGASSSGAPPCYCLRTLTVIGPDDDIVSPTECAPGRTCYESSGF